MNSSHKGRFLETLEVKVVSDKFSTQLFKVGTEDPYNPVMVFQANNDRRDVLESLKRGDEVEVTYNIRQREGKEGAWFTTLEMWKVRKFNYETVAPKTVEQKATEAKEFDETLNTPIVLPVADNLPF